MKDSKEQQKWETLFIVYMALLLGITVFRPWAISWNHFFQGSIHVKPFAEYVRLLGQGELLRVLYLLLGNIAAFIPFGMYLEYRKPEMKFGHIVLYGFLLSLAIECMQYVLGTGYTELDDLILNTVGVGVGAKLNKWNKIKFIRYTGIGVLLFSAIYSACFYKEPSAKSTIKWFTPIDCESFDGRYLAKQEISEASENPLRSIQIDIYDTENNMLVDSIYIESLWGGFQGIMWGEDNYNLAIGKWDGTMLLYVYEDGGWHEAENIAVGSAEHKVGQNGAKSVRIRRRL